MTIKMFSAVTQLRHRIQASMMGPEHMLETVRTGVVSASSNVWVRRGQPASEGLLGVVAERLSRYVATAPVADSLAMVKFMNDDVLVRCASGVVSRLPDLRVGLGPITYRRVARTIAAEGHTLNVQIAAAGYLIAVLPDMDLGGKVAVVIVAQRIADALRAANRVEEADALLRHIPAQFLSAVAELPTNPQSALRAALACEGDGPLPLPDDGRRRFV